MNDRLEPQLDLSSVYHAVKRGSVSKERQTIEVGTSVFSSTAARFDDKPGLVPLDDMLEFALIAEMTTRRFCSLAAISPFETPHLFEPLNIPTLYLFTDDMRRSCSVEAAGGLREVLRHRDDNGPESSLPVIIFVENNQQLIRAADVDTDLLEKLNTGVFARFGHGRSEKYVQGRSFQQIVSPLSPFAFGEEVAISEFRAF